MCTSSSYMIRCTHPIHHPKWHLDRFSRFLTADAISSSMTPFQFPASSKNCCLPSGYLDPSNAPLLGQPDPPPQTASRSPRLFSTIPIRYEQFDRLNDDGTRLVRIDAYATERHGPIIPVSMLMVLSLRHGHCEVYAVHFMSANSPPPSHHAPSNPQTM